MLGNRALAKKQRRKMESQGRAVQQESNDAKIQKVSEFRSFFKQELTNFMDLPLQMTFRQEHEFDEDQYFRKMLESFTQEDQYDNRVATYSIEELDHLVDFTIDQYFINCAQNKIQEEIQNICSEIVEIYENQEDFPAVSTLTKTIQNMHQTQSSTNIQNFLQIFNESTSEVIFNIRSLQFQNFQLQNRLIDNEKAILSQKNLISQGQTELQSFKNKYLSVLKQLTDFKKQLQQKEFTNTETLILKENHILELNDKIKDLNLKNQNLNTKVDELRTNFDSNSRKTIELSQKLKDKENQIEELTTKIAQLSEKFHPSPIQILNHESTDEKLSVNKSLQNINQNFSNQVQEFSVEENHFQKVTQGSNASHEVNSLKVENQILKQEINSLKMQLEKNVLEAQKHLNNEEKSSTERIGKIKKTSTNASLNKFEQIDLNNKQNQIKESNRLQNTQKMKCLNSLCQSTVKKLESKINLYKENIINLNQIINYFINHIKGYQFGTLCPKQEEKVYKRRKTELSSEKDLRARKKLEMKFDPVLDKFGNPLPIKKCSYLENELSNAFKESSEIQSNFWNNARVNTNESLNQTLKSHFFSQNNGQYDKLEKQVGKITTVHQSLNQTLPHIKPRNCFEFDQKKSKLLSKDVIKTNYENFEFIRKLCLKQEKCKDLIRKFHSYMDFYFEKIHQISLKNLTQQDHEEKIDNESFLAQRMNEIWQDNTYDEIPFYEHELSQKTSNYGLKIRSLNSSHMKSYQQ